jgi:branched-chain amino acid transport system permease protein
MVFSAVINGLLVGGVYALVALGLTLIYGVLHVVNFAHGALLMVAMFITLFIATRLGIDPYVALPFLTAAMFAIGWMLYRGIIGPVSRGEDRMLLLATLGLSIVLENSALALFTGNTQTIETPYSFTMIEMGSLLISVTKLVAFGVSILLGCMLWAFMTHTETGRAIRAVAKEPDGAKLVGIRPAKIFAFAFGLGTACLGAAAGLLLPMYYVSPHVGGVFVLVAFTIVVLGGMGSFVGAVIGALIIGVTESLGGLFLGESLGPVLIPIVFIATLLLRPAGLFGKAS